MFRRRSEHTQALDDEFWKAYLEDLRSDDASLKDKEVRPGSDLGSTLKQMFKKDSQPSPVMLATALASPFANRDPALAYDWLRGFEMASKGHFVTTAGKTKQNEPLVFAGAENWNNVMCYLDLLLFAMFATIESFEPMLFERLAPVRLPREALVARLGTLLRVYVSMLRAGQLITTDVTKRLCETLSLLGFEEAVSGRQQDCAPLFQFLTEVLDMPLLSLKMDIQHGGKFNKEDDLKITKERVLFVSVPEEDLEEEEVLLEECLETYFSNSVEVRRELERRLTLELSRTDTLAMEAVGVTGYASGVKADVVHYDGQGETALVDTSDAISNTDTVYSINARDPLSDTNSNDPLTDTSSRERPREGLANGSPRLASGSGRGAFGPIAMGSPRAARSTSTFGLTPSSSAVMTPIKPIARVTPDTPDYFIQGNSRGVSPMTARSRPPTPGDAGTAAGPAPGAAAGDAAGTAGTAATHPPRIRSLSMWSNSALREVLLPAWMFLHLLPFYTSATAAPAPCALASLTFVSRRPILPVCLKRFVYRMETGKFERLNRKVVIPPVIELPNFIASLDERYKLVLESCVCHRGLSMNLGHFVSASRKPTRDKTLRDVADEDSAWYLFDDMKRERVVETTFKKIFDTEWPYMLFYRMVCLADEVEGAGSLGVLHEAATGGELPEFQLPETQSAEPPLLGTHSAESPLPGTQPPVPLPSESSRPTLTVPLATITDVPRRLSLPHLTLSRSAKSSASVATLGDEAKRRREGEDIRDRFYWYLRNDDGYEKENPLLELSRTTTASDDSKLKASVYSLIKVALGEGAPEALHDKPKEARIAVARELKDAHDGGTKEAQNTTDAPPEELHKFWKKKKSKERAALLAVTLGGYDLERERDEPRRLLGLPKRRSRREQYKEDKCIVC